MNKLLLLTRTLRKVGSGQDNQSEKKYAGDNRQVLYIFFGIVLAAGLYFGGNFIAGDAELFGGILPIFRTFFLLVFMMVFFLSVMDLIGTLYMSTDLPALLSLPFKPNQIVVARVINTCRSSVLIASAAILPFGIGFGMKKTVSPAFWAGLVIGDICIPLTAVTAAAILIILIMSVFRVIRSRDMIRIIGALLGVGLAVLLSVAINGSETLDSDKANQAIKSVVGTFSGVSVIVPSVPLVSKAMNGGNAFLLAAVIGITAAYLGLFLLVGGTLYLHSALSMQDTGANAKAIDSGRMKNICRKKSAHEAIIIRDIKSIFRNPAYLSNGWLMTLLWPLFLLIGLLAPGENGSIFESFQMDPTIQASMAGPCIGAGLLAGLSASCLSCLGVSAINREGKSFYYMKMIPIPYAVQIRAKRDACVRIFSIGSVGYIMLLSIAGLLFRKITVFWAVYTIILTAASVMLMTNIQVLHGLSHPNLNWESESTIAKSNTFNIIIWIIGLFLIICITFLFPMLSAIAAEALGIGTDLFSWLLALLLTGVLMAAVILTDRRLGRKAEKCLEAL